MASLEPQPSLPRWSPKDCFGFRLTDSDGLESKAKKDSRKKKKKPITSSEDGPSPSIDLVHRSKSESLTNGTAQEV